jgi:hypothetical protein
MRLLTSKWNAFIADLIVNELGINRGEIFEFSYYAYVLSHLGNYQSFS